MSFPSYQCVVSSPTTEIRVAGLPLLAPLASSVVYLDVSACRWLTGESLTALSAITLLDASGCGFTERGYAALGLLTRLQALTAPEYSNGAQTCLSLKVCES